MTKRTTPPDDPNETRYTLRDAGEEYVGKERPRRSDPRRESATAGRDGNPRREGATAGRDSDPRGEGATGGREEHAFGGGITAVRDVLSPIPAYTRTTAARANRILDDLGRCGPGDEEPFLAQLRALGDEGLRALEEAFPGLLWFDRLLPHQRAPRGRSVSPIASLLVQWGPEATPVIARLLRHDDCDHRYYSLLVALDVDRPELVGDIADLLFDDDWEIREAAANGLAALAHTDAYARFVKRLSARIVDSRFHPPHRLLAIAALATLRETSSVSLLVTLLDWTEPGVRDAARFALRLITGHDLGPTAKAWAKWLERELPKGRSSWLLAAAASRDVALRDLAFVELARVTGHDFGHRVGDDSKNAARVRKQYEQALSAGR